MKTFLVPALPGETMQAYRVRVASMAWQFATDERVLTIPVVGRVTLDGDKPIGSDFVEVTE